MVFINNIVYSKSMKLLDKHRSKNTYTRTGMIIFDHNWSFRGVNRTLIDIWIYFQARPAILGI